MNNPKLHNKTIEEILKEMAKFKAESHYIFSCDIYHNDLADKEEQFVVKLHLFVDDLNDFKHFRGTKISDLLIEAFEYVVKRKESVDKKLEYNSIWSYYNSKETNNSVRRKYNPQDFAKSFRKNN